MKYSEKNIQETFLKLLETHEVDEIDVQLIATTLKIKRQTFYYHYKNMYDLIYSIYKSKVLYVNDAKSIDSIIKTFLKFLYEEEDFNREILNSLSKDIVEEFTFSYLYKAFAEYLQKYKLNIDQSKEVSRFIIYGLNYQTLHYFKTGNYTEEELYQKIKVFVNDSNIKTIISNYLKN